MIEKIQNSIDLLEPVFKARVRRFMEEADNQ
jgi:hypothetical protein